MNDNNNLNMDDLFRRAANDYPLRTDSADWDKVLGAMDEDDESFMVPAYEQKGRRSRRRFLWLLLLLPLGGLGYYSWHKGHPVQKEFVQSHAGVDASGKASGTAKASGNSPDDHSEAGTVGPVGSAGSVENTGADQPKGKESQGLASSGVEARNGGNGAAVKATNAQVEGMKAAAKKGRMGKGKAGGIAGNDEGSAVVNAEGSGIHSGETKVGRRKKLHGNTQSGMETETNGSDSSYVHTARSLEKSPMADVVPIAGGISLNFRVNGNSSLTGVSKPAVKPVIKPVKSSFYAGILVAPDMSYVKFQSVKGVGYTAGILLGYNINRNLALETGVYYDRKRYYTDGDNFSKKGLNLPSNYYLENVDGSCDMWEIPLNLRYNFGRGEKIKWFATTGLSTYLMKKEQYTYQYEDINTGTSWPKDWAGKNNSNYLFSVFNLSIGYEQSLGKIGNLRLEPYLRVPLAGFGKGSLPIMSTGLNIGITRRIW